jgi:peptidoglycan/LPS O-acetylase OafA/YrhL
VLSGIPSVLERPSPSSPARSAETAGTAYRPDIDGLRAVAVLSVVGFHAFPGGIRGGYVGVDVFFVISGFLISTIILKGLRDGSFTYRRFYARRVRRIFTALVLVLAASYAIGWYVLLPNEYEQLGKHIAGGAAFASNLMLWGEADYYFEASAEFKPLLHLWSLGIEEQFYILWPLLLAAAWKRRFNVIVVSAALLAASFAVNVLTTGRDPVGAYYSPATRLWELMTGCLLAGIALRGRLPAKWREARAAIGAAAILVAILLLDTTSRFPGWWALLPAAGAALVISAGGDTLINRRFLSNRLMVWIGLISFPLYLWHWPLLSFARMATGPADPPPHVRIGLVLLSGLLAVLTYRFVETPVRAGGRSAMKVGALCLAMLVVGAVGYQAYASEGFPSRHSAFAREIGTFKYQYKTAYRGGSCFLWAAQDSSAFGDCLGDAQVFLWGDSHAAHLLPGLQATLPGVSQFTKAGCPPLLGRDVRASTHCQEVNAHVLQLVQKHRPPRVILAAAWAVHDWRALDRTLDALRHAGVGRIDLVGPFPEWNHDLPRIVSSFVRRAGGRAPARLPTGWDRSVLSLDRDMERFAAERGVNYVSAARILCDAGGCLARVGDSAGSLVAWDRSHLTTAGSAYVVARFVR